MFVVGEVLVSEDILTNRFVCDLNACKGECCVAGDAGAPLEEDEPGILEEELENLKPFLSREGIIAIEEQGAYTFDTDGDLVTPLVEGKQCAYVVFEPDGTAACGIEKAWKAGTTAFRKPVSCHLYPIRVQKLVDMEALNYHRWDICHAACTLGAALQVPVYQFLKEALIRKYGEDWYACLEETAKNWPDDEGRE